MSKNIIDELTDNYCTRVEKCMLERAKELDVWKAVYINTSFDTEDTNVKVDLDNIYPISKRIICYNDFREVLRDCVNKRMSTIRSDLQTTQSVAYPLRICERFFVVALAADVIGSRFHVCGICAEIGLEDEKLKNIMRAGSCLAMSA